MSLFHMHQTKNKHPNRDRLTCKLYAEPGVSYKCRGSRSIDSNTAISLRIKATAGRLEDRIIKCMTNKNKFAQHVQTRKRTCWLRHREEITLVCSVWVGHIDLMCNRRHSLPFIIFIFSKRSLEHIYPFHQRLTIMFHV